MGGGSEDWMHRPFVFWWVHRPQTKHDPIGPACLGTFRRAGLHDATMQPVCASPKAVSGTSNLISPSGQLFRGSAGRS